MRIALAHHEGRISPVFDVASKVLVLEVQGGKEVGREERSLSAASPFRLAAQFLKLEADVLICGAISAPLEALLTASGVQVFGFMCGQVDEVLAKFLADGHPGPRFRMPGCGPWWAQQTEGGPQWAEDLGWALEEAAEAKAAVAAEAKGVDAAAGESPAREVLAAFACVRAAARRRRTRPGSRAGH